MFELDYLVVRWLKESGEEALVGTTMVIAPGGNATVVPASIPGDATLVFEAALRPEPGAGELPEVGFEVQDPAHPGSPASGRCVGERVAASGTEPEDATEPDDTAAGLAIVGATTVARFTHEGEFVAQAFLGGEEVGEARFFVATEHH